jgi:hypothetical protein
VAQVARPETILGWWRHLVAKKFDGSKARSYPGRPRTNGEVERLILHMARENSGWGYDRISGALANLGHKVSDRRSETFCGGMASHPLQNGIRPSHGKISWRPIWRSSQA